MKNLLKKHLIKKLTLCVTSALFTNGILACSLAPAAFKGLDTSEYIFYGEVTGHTALKNPICEPFTKQCVKAWGVEMSILSPVQLPRPEVTRVQFYMFGLGADCSRRPMPKEAMAQFAIGTRYKVAAHALSGVDQPSQRGLELLHGSEWSGARAILIPQGKDVSALRDAMEDYASDMDGDYHDRNFELTKDLVRLHTSPSIQQTLTTLKRLADFHWNVGDYGADSPEHFMALVRDHVTDAHSIQELQKRRNTTRYFNGALKEHAVDDLLLARAKDGEAEFQYHLGRRLAQTDPQSAITWLQRASDQDFVAADFELGNVYYQIAHTVKDEENLRLRQLAYKAHVRAASKGAELAEQGDAWAALILARMHSDRSAGLDWDQQKIDRYLCLGNKNRPRGYPERYIGLICK